MNPEIKKESSCVKCFKRFEFNTLDLCPRCSETESTLFDLDPHNFLNKYTGPIISKQERLNNMARRSDPQTSWDAIPTLKALTKTKQRILNLIGATPSGLTSSEVSLQLDIDKSSAGKRLGDLEREGYLCVEGTRLSDRGRSSSIYKTLFNREYY